MSFEHPFALALLVLATLPWLRGAGGAARYSSLDVLPPDAISDALSWLLKLAASGAIAALALGLAGLNRPAESVERIGRGAEIVLVLDRSRSMDQALHQAPRSLADLNPAFAAPQGEPKIRVARRLLAEFAAARPEDRFAMVVFSAFPMRALDFTQKPEAIQAAIRAGDVGKGLSDTDVGRGLLAGLELFEGRPYAGSRVVLLVSDGGAHLDDDTQRGIAEAARRHRVSLYWIYIRSAYSPGLLPGKDVSEELAATVPEHFLHEFFGRIGTPYRAYEAEDPEAMKRAIADVSRLESFPIRYFETTARRDLSQACYLVALALALLPAAAAAIEVRRWRPN